MVAFSGTSLPRIIRLGDSSDIALKAREDTSISKPPKVIITAKMASSKKICIVPAYSNSPKTKSKRKHHK